MIKTESVINVFESDIAELWDEKGNLVKEVIENDDPIKDEILLHLKNNINILDVGCGTGGMLHYIDSKISSSTLIGVDVSSKMIDCALKKNTSEKNKFGYIVADIQREVFKPNLFDLIIAKQVLHHFAEPQMVIRNISKLLRKNGKAIIMVPGVGYQLGLIEYNEEHDLLGRFSVDKIEKMIMQNGMIPIRLIKQKFLFKFDSFEKYIRFLYCIGSLQKLSNYALKINEEYVNALHSKFNVDGIVEGEYLVAVCVNKEDSWKGGTDR